MSIARLNNFRRPLISSTSRLLPSFRPLHRTSTLRAGDDAGSKDGAMPDALAERSAKGRTGGGEMLDSSSRNAPPKPKISNLSVPGRDMSANLTEEQKEEVERHNRDFEAKHDRGNTAPDDKVDKKFWSGEGH